MCGPLPAFCIDHAQPPDLYYCSAFITKNRQFDNTSVSPEKDCRSERLLYSDKQSRGWALFRRRSRMHFQSHLGARVGCRALWYLCREVSENLVGRWLRPFGRQLVVHENTSLQLHMSARFAGVPTWRWRNSRFISFYYLL